MILPMILGIMKIPFMMMRYPGVRLLSYICYTAYCLDFSQSLTLVAWLDQYSVLFQWGGISSLEHDEAVMLEAAMFGGIPEGSGYHFPYAPHQLMHGGGLYPRQAPRPPSPSLEAQRLIREQQVCF